MPLKLQFDFTFCAPEARCKAAGDKAAWFSEPGQTSKSKTRFGGFGMGPALRIAQGAKPGEGGQLPGPKAQMLVVTSRNGS